MIKKIFTMLFMAIIALLFALLVAIVTDYFRPIVAPGTFSFIVMLCGLISGLIGWALGEFYIKVNGF